MSRLTTIARGDDSHVAEPRRVTAGTEQEWREQLSPDQYRVLRLQHLRNEGGVGDFLGDHGVP